MKIGFIGLGKMGLRMTSKLLQEGHEIIVWNRSQQAVDELRIRNQESWKGKKMHNSKFMIHDSMAGKLEVAKTIEMLIRKLKSPRIVWLMLPAGEATEAMLLEVSKFVEKDDIVIDGGNSNFKDTQRRYEELRTKNIKFLGIGVSGGVIAFQNGYPLMAGGDKSGYDYIVPILDSLSKPNGGHEYFGVGGAGHFVKMIHNGIEYGIMQSLGEGFEVLQKAQYKFDLLKVAKLYQKDTLISGFMLDRTVEALQNDPKLANIVGVITESGEAKWTVEQAKEEKVDVEIIERSLEYRRRSQIDKRIQKSFTAKLVAALRNAFGGHPVKKNPGK